MKPLFKTTIVIWSEYDGTACELDSLAQEATEGDAYCSKFRSEFVKEPDKDPDWDGTEFFDEDEGEVIVDLTIPSDDPGWTVARNSDGTPFVGGQEKPDVSQPS